jgi:competence protein ComEA
MPAPDPLKQYRFYIAMFVLNLAVVVGVIYLVRREEPRQLLITTPSPRPETNVPTPIAQESKSLRVVVQGAVNRPGTVQLDSGASLADALQKAGGVTQDADLSNLDLTLALKDGDKISVPPRASGQVPANEPLTPSNAIPTHNAAASPPPSGVTSSAKLNLNTATLKELDRLPGIGPVLAQRILDYRQAHGSFRSVEELKQVRGIGDALYDEIKDKVTVP